jgi:hypothetical protein
MKSLMPLAENHEAWHDAYADSWDWVDEKNHLLALQAKLNAYFEFIQSGQIHESFPEAAGRRIVINVIGRYPIPKAGMDLLTKAAAVSTDLLLTVRSQHYPGVQS